MQLKLPKARTLFYRRTNRPYAYPALTADHVEVTDEPQTTGPGDNDWQAVTWDGEAVSGIPSHAEPMLIADEIICELAVRRFCGAKEFSELAWNPWMILEPDDLDDSGPDAHEALCDAVEDAYGHDASQSQRIALRMRMSEEYCASHSIDRKTGEYR